MDPHRVQLCREWIARRTAYLDQKQKEFEAQYAMQSPEVNFARLTTLEAARFWVDIHRWELDQMIETGVDDYPQGLQMTNLIPREEQCLTPPDYDDPTCHPGTSIPCYLPKGHDEGEEGTPHTWQSSIKR